MYNRFVVGPNLRNIRKDRGLTIAQVGIMTGISDEMIAKIEQGNRNMTIQTMFAFMEAYEVDANTLLCVRNNNNSIDERLAAMAKPQREYFTGSFLYMLEQVKGYEREVAM